MTVTPYQHAKTTRRKAALLLTVCLSAAIFVLALIPLEIPPAVPGTDKQYHLIAFSALTLPLAILYPRALIWALPAIILQAGLIEIVQPYVNRVREWADFAAGLKGIALGLGFGLAMRGAAVMLSQKRAKTPKMPEHP